VNGNPTNTDTAPAGDPPVPQGTIRMSLQEIRPVRLGIVVARMVLRVRSWEFTMRIRPQKQKVKVQEGCFFANQVITHHQVLRSTNYIRTWEIPRRSHHMHHQYAAEFSRRCR
jgi:hypothetical protein